MNSAPASIPGSPIGSERSIDIPPTHYSEVPTEPLPASELRLINEHMTRRKHFLSDYERYNPVQNMHALANHVFDLSENVHRLGGEAVLNRRMLDIVSKQQRETNETLSAMGNDVTNMRGEVGQLCGGIQQLHSDFRGEAGHLREEFEGRIGSLEGQVILLEGQVTRLEGQVQMGFAELKGMISVLVGSLKT